MTFTLEVTKREERGKATRKLRAAGKTPAVVYGPKEGATPVTVDTLAFAKLFREAGESSIISLSGLDGKKDVLVQEVTLDPLKGEILHVDFYAVEQGKELTLDVPLVFVGEAPALKLGGTLTKVMHELEVTCEISKLPKEIEVDLSSLVDLESQIHVKDLVLPAGVRTEDDAEGVVALIQAVEEEVEAPVEAVDMDAVEVEKKGKTETPEEAPAA